MTIINIFRTDNCSITKIKTRHCQIMKTIANRNLKFKSMIKITIGANYGLLNYALRTTVITFINIYHLYQVYLNIVFIRLIYKTQKDCHQDCLQLLTTL